MFGLFSLLDLFAVAQSVLRQVVTVPLFVENPGRKQNFGGGDGQWRCSPWNTKKWKNCVKFQRKFYKEFLRVQADPCSGDILRTGNWLRGLPQVGTWKGHPANATCHAEEYLQQDSSLVETVEPDTDTDAATVIPQQKQQLSLLNKAPADADYVLLEHVFAGTGRNGLFGCEHDCSLHEGQQWYRFRHFLFEHLHGPSEGCAMANAAPAGYITFSLSVKSSRSHLVWDFAQEIELAKQRYGEEAVRVVDMSELTMKEQSELAANTAVYLTNHGGVGATSVFVPRGSSVLVFWHGSQRMDGNFYESAGYFHVNWISKQERQHVNATMALIDAEVERVALEHPNILPAQKH